MGANPAAENGAFAEPSRERHGLAAPEQPQHDGDEERPGQQADLGQQLERGAQRVALGQTLVKSIELRIDPKTLAKARGTSEGSKKERLDYKIPEELVTAAAGIEDTKLRRAFLGAATSCIRRIETSSES